MALVLFALWAFCLIYGLTRLVALISRGVRALWSLLPDNPEAVESRRRMAADREAVRLGRAPGV
jgi:hypothetical protein